MLKIKGLSLYGEEPRDTQENAGDESRFYCIGVCNANRTWACFLPIGSGSGE